LISPIYANESASQIVNSQVEITKGSVVQQAHFIKQHDLGAGGERSRATISPNEVSRARNAD